MEFFMTHAWVMIVIVLVLGGLVYMGALNFERPNKCVVKSDGVLQCVDVSADVTDPDVVKFVVHLESLNENMMDIMVPFGTPTEMSEFSHCRESTNGATHIRVWDGDWKRWVGTYNIRTISKGVEMDLYFECKGKERKFKNGQSVHAEFDLPYIEPKTGMKRSLRIYIDQQTSLVGTERPIT